MRLENNNAFIEINIINYEFTDIEKSNINNPYDKNWLMINVNYSEDTCIVKSFIECCILTFEWNSIINEFKEIYKNEKKNYKSDFIEPYINISLKRQNDDFTIIIEFITDIVNDEYIDFNATLNKTNLKELIENMESEIGKFPER